MRLSLPLFALVPLLAACPAKQSPRETTPTPIEGSTEGAPGTEPPGPAPAGPGGAVQLTGAKVLRGFGLGPGAVYYCDHSVRAVPKTGGRAREFGACTSPFNFIGDGRHIYFCERGGLKRITDGGASAEMLVAQDTCILKAVDGDSVYYIVPFAGAQSPGLYRLAKSGGKPALLYPTRRGEQIMMVLDGNDVLVGSWNSGTISRLARTGGKPTPVVTGQRGVVNVAADEHMFFWYVESSREIRRRKKEGGAIEVIGHNVDQEPLLVHAGHAYWFEGSRGEPKRLMHLAPGAARAEALASDLPFPMMRVDDDGIFFTLAEQPGIFRLPAPR